MLQIFKQSKKPLTPPELLRALKLPKRESEAMEGLLMQLEREGKVLRLRRGAYGLVENLKLVTGTLEVQRSGVGFVIPDEKKRQDIFVNPANMGGAWNGDRVAVAIFPDRSGRREEGRIARVLERRTTRLSARVSRKFGGQILCHATDSKQNLQFMIETSALGQDVQEGDVLLVEPKEHLDRELWSATILEFLGREDDVLVQEALVKANHDVPTAFPNNVLQEAAALPEKPDEADFQGRKDLRDLDLVTIDGVKAKDFDDAICVKKEQGGYRLWVAIADVAHYVPEGTALDKEAFARGNSYYFPQSVEPMFPEALSNGLCSLNPHVERLAMVAELKLSSSGVPVDADTAFYPAVILSKARLTYSLVKRAILDKEEDARDEVAAVLPMLETAEVLARQLRMRREERGSLDFDLPEPELLFNLQGETVDIRPKVRHFGHQIIEEFMIAANEAVARRLRDRALPCLYRVHEEPDPDKLQALYDVVIRSELAEKVQRPAKAPSPLDLQQLLAVAEDSDMEYVVGRLTLRSMMQAKYSPVNTGHYGLASECYCHFTSPIRRYADLVVHRSVKRMLADEGLHPGQPAPPRERGLKKVGAHLSEMERKAMDAERETLKRITVLFLRDRVGEDFTGVINSIADFGFWVELKEVMAEGMVRLSTMHDDYYGYIPERQELLGERTGRRFRMGQTVRVRLAEVNLARLEITLEILEGGDSKKTRGRKPAPVKEYAGTQGRPAGRRPGGSGKTRTSRKQDDAAPGKGGRKRPVSKKRPSGPKKKRPGRPARPGRKGGSS